MSNTLPPRKAGVPYTKKWVKFPVIPSAWTTKGSLTMEGSSFYGGGDSYL